MKNILNSLFFYYILFALVSCSQSAGQGVEKLNAGDFEKKMASLKEVQLVDVRTPEEYQKGHLKNAMLMNFNGSEFQKQIESLDKNKPVFLYCLAGGRSGEASKILADKGFKQIYDLEGGYMQWTRANKEVEVATAKTESKGGVSPEDLDKIVKANKLVLVDYGAVWCGPCKKMAPTIEKLKEEKKSVLYVLNVDADESVQLAEKEKIEALPTLVIYKEQKEVWRNIGYMTEEDINAVLKKYL